MKENKKETKNIKIKKDGFLKRIKNEMKLVKWPEVKDVVKFTIATIIFCLLISAFFLLLDFALSIIKGWFV